MNKQIKQCLIIIKICRRMIKCIIVYQNKNDYYFDY